LIITTDLFRNNLFFVNPFFSSYSLFLNFSLYVRHN